MGYERRLALIEKIQQMRGSKLLCFLTTVRPNVAGAIADDCVRVFFDHLLKVRMPEQEKHEKIDLFLCSNGGHGTVPWRLVPLFREYAKSFNVLIPYRAYSAATLIALGADEIVMHPFGEMGPIDPTVENNFNPTDPTTNQRIGISVEDVKAYVNFIKSTVGITHEDELVQAIKVLVEKVHPLALGNVERFLAQSRMIAAKILRTHNKKLADHEIEEIVENMASKLYFHGHPINRKEAREELHLDVKDAPLDLETAMWDLYRDFEDEFRSTEIFNPVPKLLQALDQQIRQGDLRQMLQNASQLIEEVAQAGQMPPAALGPAVIQQSVQLAQQALQLIGQVGQNLPQLIASLQPNQAQQVAQTVAQATAQLTQQVQALLAQLQNPKPLDRVQELNGLLQNLIGINQAAEHLAPPEVTEDLLAVAIESEAISSKLTTSVRFRLYPAPQTQPSVPPPLSQYTVRQDPLSQKWSHLLAQAAQPEAARQ